MMGWGVTDYPGPPTDSPAPLCPICGEETETLYANIDGEIVGCPECLKFVDAWLWKEANE